MRLSPETKLAFIRLVGFTFVFERVFSVAGDLSDYSKVVIIDVNRLASMASAT
jgi:hypothetical protein